VRLVRPAALGFLLLYVAVCTRHRFKPMPPGTDLAGSWNATSSEHFELLFDLTYRTDEATTVKEQVIFDRLLRLISEARSFVVLDQFLFNDFAGEASGQRSLADELTAALTAKLQQTPGFRALLITDPINRVYGGETSPYLDRLAAAGVDVVITDLGRLRDSNFLYSSLWRIAIQWWGNDPGSGGVANPFQSGDQTTLRSWLALINFKANHRKVAVADREDGAVQALVASANPHDASSSHSNVGLLFAGPTAADILSSELEIARFSGWTSQLPEPSVRASVEGGELATRFVSEGAIRDSLVDALARLTAGDSVDMAMFYLSDRRIIEALIRAADAGAAIRLLLDPNRDAFGREKDGVPNRPVANELRDKSDGRIEVRWYHTDGEQFHTKLTVIRHGDSVLASLGSANLTRRNIGNFNLEANVEVRAPLGSDLDQQLAETFDRLWLNRNHALYSKDFQAFADSSQWRYWRYRVMEATGLSTF
jgi:phosphatidylserine/phosphatidylglycerophosphate/cardiolipin synthase-like enzyme